MRSMPPSPSDFSFKRKNQSPHARYAPPSPSDFGGNYPLSTKGGSPSSLIKEGHDMKQGKDFEKTKTKRRLPIWKYREILTSALERRRLRPSPSAFLVVCFAGYHRQVYVPTISNDSKDSGDYNNHFNI